VVCRDFIAPKHLDPKFLDPKHAFREVQTTGPNNGTSSKNVHANVFLPEKNRRKRDGYDEGDYTLFKRLPASEFVKSDEPVALLGSSNQITFDSDEEAQYVYPCGSDETLTGAQMVGSRLYHCRDKKLLR
jgi:AdoMet-dependent rRNA methyltransferase SPB1